MGKIHTQGFTIIEVIVTLTVVALFVTLFFQSYFASESQRTAVARRGTATDIAYSNLGKFPTKAGLPCTTAMDQSGTNSPAKPGLIIGSSNAALNPAYGFAPVGTDQTGKLGAYVEQTVKIFAPRGCSVATSPIRIESWVIYGPTSTSTEKVVHAAYIN